MVGTRVVRVGLYFHDCSPDFDTIALTQMNQSITYINGSVRILKSK